MRFSIRLVALAFAVVATAPAMGDDGNAPIQVARFSDWFEPFRGDQIAASKATLWRDSERFEFEAITRAIPGEAATIWVCGFNDPSGCVGPGTSTPSCSFDDYFNAAAEPFCQWGAGAIVDGSGEYRARGTDATTQVLFGAGLTNLEGAEIELYFHSHGPRLAGDTLADQLTSFEGACSEVPPGFPECENECVNDCMTTQVASFGTPPPS